MMETILNVGLAPSTIPGLIAKTNNPRFVYDAYRRLIMMYSDVVMEKAAGIEPAGEQGIRKQLEAIMHGMKEKQGREARHRAERRRPEGAGRAVQGARAQGPRQAVPGRADGPVVGQRRAPCSRAGTAAARSSIAASRRSRTNGARRSPSRRWSSATPATPPPRAWASRATRPPGGTSSTASGSRTRRARTSSPASARRCR